MTRLGAGEVTALGIVAELVEQHTELGGPFQEIRSPAVALRQPTRRWMDELAPMVRPGQEVFSRLALVLVCLLDPSTAAAAERSGMLWWSSERIQPTLPDLLTEAGVELVRRRAPVLAIGLGLTPPALQLRGLVGGRPVLALAVQPAPTGIGSWAAGAVGIGVYRGTGGESSVVVPEVMPTGLLFKGNDELIVAHNGGITRQQTGFDLQPQPQWGSVTSLSISDGVLLAVVDGKCVSGVFDKQDAKGTNPLSGSPVEHIAGWPGDNRVVGGGMQLAIGNRHGDWEYPAGLGPEVPLTALAAGRDGDIVAGFANGTVRCLRQPGVPADPGSPSAWSAVEIGPAETSAPPVTLLAAGPDGLAASAGDGQSTYVAVYRREHLIGRILHPDAVRALSLSPDGVALGTIDAAGVLRVWRIDATVVVPPTSYTPDDLDGEDLLNISTSVDAMAALISARVVTPPLAVGLFGAWGAGKSFFLHRLMRQVKAIGDDARASQRAQRDLWSWRNITQISFNAWTYAASDVWAGLVEHLLRGLVEAGPPIGGLPDGLEEIDARRVERLIQTQSVRAAADDKLRAARKQHQSATQKLEEVRHELDQARQEAEHAATQVRKEALPDVGKEVNQILTSVGLDKVGAKAGELYEALGAARRSLTSVHALLIAPDRRLLFVAAIGGPLCALLIGVVFKFVEPQLVALGGTTAGLAAGLSTLVGWLSTSTRWVNDRLRQIQKVEDDLHQQVQALEQKVQTARTDQAASERTLADAERNAARAEQHLTAAQSEAAQNTAASLLAEYISDRAGSADYRGRLGMIATVRQDIETISRAVAYNNDRLITSIDPSANGDAVNDEAVNRIVLYIDDLDRCPPTVVVKVLEAVSLLLSYPLFVVVIAVDAHWLSRSLLTVYREMFATSELTPDDYLEKIIQLPVWLDPMPVNTARRLITALLDAEPSIDVPVAGRSASSQPLPERTVVDIGGEHAASRDPRSPTARIDRPSHPETNPAGTSSWLLATSPPAVLRLSDEERTNLVQLAPLLTRSPRTLKRFLNTYRLLKASVHGDEQLIIAQFLLAVACGRPATGNRLLQILAEEAPPTGSSSGNVRTGRGESVADAIAQLPDADQRWLSSTQFARRADYWSRTSTRELLPQVRRYLFRTQSSGPNKETTSEIPQHNDSGRSEL